MPRHKRDYTFPPMSSLNAELISKYIATPDDLTPAETEEMKAILASDPSIAEEVQRIRDFRPITK